MTPGKLQLLEDCARNDKLAAFNAFSDFVLKMMLWLDGFEPTCAAIAGDDAKHN